MIPDAITDYKAKAYKWLTVQFRRAENVLGLLRGTIKSLDEIEAVLMDISKTRSIDEATGAALDLWGRLLDVPRDGLEDDIYKMILKVKIAVNNSDGTPEELIFIAKELTGADSVHYRPLMMVYTMELNDATIPEGGRLKIRNLLQAATIGGERFEYGIEADEATFRFDTGPGFDVGEFGRSF